MIYELEKKGLHTYVAAQDLGLVPEARDFSGLPEILNELCEGKSIRLITNNPYKIDGLKKGGVRVVGNASIVIPPTADNKDYLATKRDIGKHMLPKYNDEAEMPREL